MVHPAESCATLIHNGAIHSETKGSRAGAATIPALNSRLVWRHPGTQSSLRTSKFAGFCKRSAAAEAKTHLVCPRLGRWVVLQWPAYVLGWDWFAPTSPHPPHTHEEA